MPLSKVYTPLYNQELKKIAFSSHLEAHSFVSTEQSSPVYPSLHSHSNLLSRSRQATDPEGSQGSWEQSSMATSQVRPVNPGRHSHSNDVPESKQKRNEGKLQTILLETRDLPGDTLVLLG